MSKGTTRRTVRIEDGLWEQARAKAEHRGDNLSDIIRERLKQLANEQENVVAKEPVEIDASRVDAALRELIDDIDHDTHKYLECDEDEGRDRYPELVKTFIKYYQEGGRKL